VGKESRRDAATSQSKLRQTQSRIIMTGNVSGFKGEVGGAPGVREQLRERLREQLREQPLLFHFELNGLPLAVYRVKDIKRIWQLTLKRTQQ